MARCCLEIATRDSDRRKAFGETIRKFEAVSFRVADLIARLDAARSLVDVAEDIWMKAPNQDDGFRSNEAST